MLAVPNSRLILHSVEGNHRQKLRDQFAADGINPQRLQFVAYLPLIEYLEQYHQIDIALDTFPYNAHATACDFLWAGVPVVTLTGGGFAGRVGASVPAATAPGDVVLLTVTSDPASLASLGRALDTIGERGMTPVSVTELLAS